jgi:hypothetical protein
LRTLFPSACWPSRPAEEASAQQPSIIPRFHNIVTRTNAARHLSRYEQYVHRFSGYGCMYKQRKGSSLACRLTSTGLARACMCAAMHGQVIMSINSSKKKNCSIFTQTRPKLLQENYRHDAIFGIHGYKLGLICSVPTAICGSVYPSSVVILVLLHEQAHEY